MNKVFKLEIKRRSEGEDEWRVDNEEWCFFESVSDIKQEMEAIKNAWIKESEDPVQFRVAAYVEVPLNEGPTTDRHLFQVVCNEYDESTFYPSLEEAMAVAVELSEPESITLQQLSKWEFVGFVPAEHFEWKEVSK